MLINLKFSVARTHAGDAHVESEAARESSAEGARVGEQDEGLHEHVQDEVVGGGADLKVRGKGVITSSDNDRGDSGLRPPGILADLKEEKAPEQVPSSTCA